ncbi:hypothetical protein RI367_007119 [Sorochytrium milnesiophthora]
MYRGWLTYGGQVKDVDITYKCMKQALDLGINFFDTAEVYAQGQSEIDMGHAIKKLDVKRSDLVISTKMFWGGDGPNNKGLSRKHIVEGTMASLKRLQLDYVDVIFAHRPDASVPIEETVRAFNWLIDQGKAFYWGTSEWSAQEITEAHLVAQRLGLVGPTCEQPQYNMFERARFEKEYDALYKRFGLGTTIWSPLASGVLTGKYNDLDNIPADSRLALKDNAIMERYRKELQTEDGKAKIDKVKKLTPIAKRLGGTPAQLALAWCVKNAHVSTVITGASKPEQIVENVKSLELVPKLTDEVMKEIDAILDNKPQAEPTSSQAMACMWSAGGESTVAALGQHSERGKKDKGSYDSDVLRYLVSFDPSLVQTSPARSLADAAMIDVRIRDALAVTSTYLPPRVFAAVWLRDPVASKLADTVQLCPGGSPSCQAATAQLLVMLWSSIAAHQQPTKQASLWYEQDGTQRARSASSSYTYNKEYFPGPFSIDDLYLD